MHMPSLFRLVTPLIVASLIVCVPSTRTSAQIGPAPASLDEVTDGFGAAVKADVAKLRAATDAFHDLAKAQAAGYPTTTPNCVADSTMGGMGYHIIDRKSIDDKQEIEHPEMLIYATDGEGKPELVAVEYIVPYRVHPATEKPPQIGRASCRERV